MKKRLIVAAVAAALIGLATVRADEASLPMSAPRGTPEMFGDWTVTKVLCTDCAGRTNPEVGTKIVLSDGAFKDPFSTDCAKGAAYPNRKLSWQTAFKLFNLPKDAHSLASPQDKITDARLNCDGGPVARVLFIGRDKAVYIFEGEDFLIERAKTP